MLLFLFTSNFYEEDFCRIFVLDWLFWIFNVFKFTVEFVFVEYIEFGMLILGLFCIDWAISIYEGFYFFKLKILFGHFDEKLL